jgi:hypothetical protein
MSGQLVLHVLDYMFHIHDQELESPPLNSTF